MKLFTYLDQHLKLLVPFGFFAGLILGGIARAWMRWISDDPEFTWSGSLGIVIGFAIFGAVQAFVYSFRQRPRSKSASIIVRSLGVIFSLQLFIAAGAIMLPSVLTASLARWRTNWKSWIRIVLGLASLTAWLVIVKSEILDTFGWDIITLGRILLFATIYIVIIATLKPTVSDRI